MIYVSNSIDMNTMQITNLGAPSNPNDAATKAFVEQLYNNRTYKDPIRVAVGSNVNITSPGATLDGVTMASGDRVGLYGQTTPNQNGIYVWNGAAAAMTRAPDADSSAEVKAGLTAAVTEGTSADRWFILTTDGTITLGTTALTFIVMSNSGMVYTAGNGLQLSAGAFSILLDSNSGLVVSGSGLKLDSSVVMRKFQANIGNGSATTVNVVHNLGNKDVLVGLYKASDGRAWIPDVEYIDTTQLNLYFGAAPASNAMRVIVGG